MSSVRHHAVRGLACLFAGVLISYVVAICCIRFAPPSQSTQMRKLDPATEYSPLYDKGHFTQFIMSASSGLGWSSERHIASRGSLTPYIGHSSVTSAGWPFTCFTGAKGKIKGMEHHHTLFRWPKPVKGRPQVVPYGPLWPGLAANTVIYGSAVWLLLSLRAGRRGVRRWRNCCPWCGYSRQGADRGTPCPECGRSDAIIVS